MFLKKGLKILLTALLFIFFNNMVKANQQQDINYLIQAFKSTGAKLDTYYLHMGIPFGEYQGDELLLAEGNKLSESLALPKAKSLNNFNEQKYFLSEGSWGNGTVVELQLKKIAVKSNEVYLLFNLKGNDSIESLETYYTFLMNRLQQNQLSPKINSCIQGNLNDKLNNKDQIVLIEEIIHTLDGKKIESLNTDLVKSFSIYTPKIEHSIWTGNKKMNMQIATHVNILEQKTMLTIGTPIIKIEY